MYIAIVGTGYVGLVTGACLAEMGHTVTCVDIDKDKIRKLNQGITPIYEPGLEGLIEGNVEAERLHFTTSLADAMAEAAAVFIAVGTPARDDGSANLDYVLGVAREIGKNLDQSIAIPNHERHGFKRHLQIHGSVPGDGLEFVNGLLNERRQIQRSAHQLYRAAIKLCKVK